MIQVVLFPICMSFSSLHLSMCGLLIVLVPCFLISTRSVCYKPTKSTNEALYKLKALTNDYPDYGKMIEDKIIGAGFSIPHAASSVRSSRSSVTSMSSRASPRSFSSRRSSSSIAGSARSSKSGAVINLELSEESR